MLDTTQRIARRSKQSRAAKRSSPRDLGRLTVGSGPVAISAISAISVQVSGESSSHEGADNQHGSRLLQKGCNKIIIGVLKSAR